MKIKVQRLRDDVPLPAYQTAGSLGMDLHAAIDEPVVLRVSKTARVPTGIAVELPPNLAALVVPRSGLASRGIIVLNSPGLVDTDYRGEVCVLLANVIGPPVTIEPGDRIAQLLFVDVERVEWQVVEELSETDRGAGGFGSTGTG